MVLVSVPFQMAAAALIGCSEPRLSYVRRADLQEGTMDPLALIHDFLDQTRPPATRVAEAEAIRQFFLAPEAPGRHEPYSVLAHNALRVVFLDPMEAAEVRQAALQAHLPLLSPASQARLGQLYAQDPSGLHAIQRDLERDQRRETLQVDPEQAELLQRDLERLQQRLTISHLEAISAYGRDPRVLAALAEAVRYPDPAIREAALWGLGYLGDLPAVMQALHEAVPTVRVAAAQVLGRYAARREELAALTSALDDPNLDARGAAQIALRHLGLRPQVPLPPTQPAVPAPQAARASSLQFPWVTFLNKVSWAVLQRAPEDLPAAVITSGWLGYSGATEASLQAAEQRLGRRLPPSYRQFLQVSNGWRDDWLAPFLPIEQVDHFWSRDADFAQMWEQEGAEALGDRTAELEGSIQISERGEHFLCLLNPAVVTPAGEWEAWLLDSEMEAGRQPQLECYPSFWALLQEGYESFFAE
jgi:hypothetical protein